MSAMGEIHFLTTTKYNGDVLNTHETSQYDVSTIAKVIKAH